MKYGWIDFSRNERNIIMRTFKALEIPSARDELGIGVIRDAYSDLMFPGISTQQTRAKYFVLIPYIFSMAVEKGSFKRANEVLPWIHRHEDQIVKTLLEKSDDLDGIIGRRMDGQNMFVKTKPSSIYWSGLRTYEILSGANTSISYACQVVYGKNLHRNSFSEIKNKDEDGHDDNTAQNENTPLFFMPPLPANLMNEAQIELTLTEKEFLLERMTKTKNVKNSLLAHMLKKRKIYKSFFDINPNDPDLPGDLGETVYLAQRFSDFIHGAHLRYNMIFSESLPPDMDPVKAKEITVILKSAYENWQKTFDFETFDLLKVLSKVNNRSDSGLEPFVDSFLNAAKNGNNEEVDRLIIAREKFQKKDRAKLLKPQEHKFYHVHWHKLNYRYDTAKTIINDILKPQGGI